MLAPLMPAAGSSRQTVLSSALARNVVMKIALHVVSMARFYTGYAAVTAVWRQGVIDVPAEVAPIFTAIA